MSDIFNAATAVGAQAPAAATGDAAADQAAATAAAEAAATATAKAEAATGVDPAAAAKASAAAQELAAKEQNKPWYAALPETAHEALKGFDTVDALVAAAKTGTELAPAKDVTEYKLSFPGHEGELDPGSKAVLDKFAAMCLEKKINPAQAQDLLNWQTELAAETSAERVRTGQESLRTLWGTNYDANLQKGLITLQRLDRMMGGELLPGLQATGLATDPFIAKVAHLLSGLISEDSLGAHLPGAADVPVTAVEQYRQMGFK